MTVAEDWTCSQTISRCEICLRTSIIWVDPARGISLKQQFFTPSEDVRTTQCTTNYQVQPAGESEALRDQDGLEDYEGSAVGFANTPGGPEEG